MQGTAAPGTDPGRVPPVRIGLALPQYDYSIAGESPLRWASVVEYARAAEAGWVRLPLGVGPPVPRRRQVRRFAGASRRARSDRRARQRWRASCRGRGSGRWCSAKRSVPRRSSRSRWRRSTASATVGSTSASARAGTNPSTRPSACRCRARVNASRGSREASERAPRAPRWGAVHLRRPVPPRVRRPQRTGGRPATDTTDRRRREGRPSARARRRAGRRLEHLLGLDARCVPRAARRARARLRGHRPRSGVGVALAGVVRVVRGGRARPRAPLHPAPRVVAPRRARRHLPGRVAPGSAGRNGRAGPGAGLRLGGPRRRDPDPGRRGRALRRHRPSTTWNCSPMPSGGSGGLQRR